MNSTSVNTALQNNTKVLKNMNTTKERMLETLNRSATIKKSKSFISPPLTPIVKEESNGDKEPAVEFKPVKLHNFDSVIART